MLVPKLRFKREDDSEYLEWEEKAVGEVCSVSTGKSNTQDKIDEGQYPFYVRSPIIEHSDKYLFDEEAVITVGDGVGTGKVYHYVNGKYNLHQRCYRMYDFTSVIAKYFYYVFSTHFYKRIKSMSAKTSVDSVRMEMITDMRISFPCFEEQQKIADFLSTVDEVIAQSEAEVQNLEQQKKAAMQKIFSQEVRFKHEDGTDYPEWEEKTLQDCTQFIKDGTHATHKNAEQGYYLLSAKDVYDGAIHTFEDSRIISKDDYNTIYKQYSLNVGDVILTIVGTLGRVAVVTENDIDVAFQRSVAIIRPNETMDSYYLRYEMEDAAFQKELDIRKSRGAQAGVYLGVLSEIIMKMPCLEEQQKIADFLSAYDEAIRYAKQELEHWKQLKKGLLQQMFV